MSALSEEGELALHHAVALGLLSTEVARSYAPEVRDSKAREAIGEPAWGALTTLARAWPGSGQRTLDLTLLSANDQSRLLRSLVVEAIRTSGDVDPTALAEVLESLSADEPLEQRLVLQGLLEPAAAMSYFVDAAQAQVVCPDCFEAHDAWSPRCARCQAPCTVLPEGLADGLRWIGVVFDGKYRVRELLGRGGMGTVYLGHHERLDQAVAIKLLTGSSPALGARFLREAQLASRLSHPNVVTVRDFGDQDGVAFMVMDYCTGVSVRDFINDRAPLEIEPALDLAIQTLEGLAEAHRLKVVHLDLKPSNLMLEPEGRLRILDFGLAKALSELASVGGGGLNSGGPAPGTPAYMSPEQAAGLACDARTDLYSVGLLLGELLGQPLPDSGGANPWLGTELPRWLQSLLKRATAPNPDQRFQSADEFLGALRSRGSRGIPRAARVALGLLVCGACVALPLGWRALRERVPPADELAKISRRTFGPLSRAEVPTGRIADQVALGRALYAMPLGPSPSSPSPSGPSPSGPSPSCASCHPLSRHGAQPSSSGRDTMSSLNLAPQLTFFWDGRATSLEDLARRKLWGPEGAFKDKAELVDTLQESSISKLHSRAFGETRVRAENLSEALSLYLESLVTPAPFDVFMSGDSPTLEPRELRGLHLFVERGCTTCHIGPGVGGTMVQILGLKVPYPTEDLGRAKITGLESDRGVFKVPSLRNVSETGPYLHDGSLASLEETVEVMGRYQLGLELSDEDRDDIVLFLRTLSAPLDPSWQD